MGIKSIAFAAAVTLGAFGAAAPASAALIHGAVDFGGSVVVVGPWTAPTGLDFTGTIAAQSGDPGTFDLTFLPDTSTGTIKDLTFSDFSAPGFNIPDFFQMSNVGGSTLHFELDSITDIVLTTGGTGYGISIFANGKYSITGPAGAGFDTTNALLTISLTCTASAGKCDPNAVVTVQGVSSSAPVPEPASIALLGAGLAGLGIRRKKRAS